MTGVITFKSMSLARSPKRTRVDIVFIGYQENSIKEGTRGKCLGEKGKGIRRMEESKDQKTWNWERFIALREYKTSLVNFRCIELSTCYKKEARR